MTRFANRRLILALGLASVLLGPTVPALAEGELLAVVYAKTADGGKGRRLHRQVLLPAATEEHSAAITLCGTSYYAYESELEELRAFDPATHLIILFRTSLDPATKNSRREELCRAAD